MLGFGSRSYRQEPNTCASEGGPPSNSGESLEASSWAFWLRLVPLIPDQMSSDDCPPGRHTSARFCHRDCTVRFLSGFSLSQSFFSVHSFSLIIHKFMA